jgi:ectoine hydrolase
MSAPTKPELVFDRAEYAQRVTRTQTRMREQGVDVLVVADPANMDWLTGFDNWSFYTPQAVVLGVDAAGPLLVARHVERAVAEWSVYLDPANVVLYPERYILDSRLHPFQFVAEMLADRYGTRVMVGVELDAICYTPRAHEELHRALPDAPLGRRVPARQLVADREIAGGDRGPARGRRHRRQRDGAGNRSYQRRHARVRRRSRALPRPDRRHRRLRREHAHPAEHANGAKTSAPHLSWTDAPYQPDTATNIELGGSGYEKESRIGYSIGLGYPPAVWIEQTASLAEGDETVLAENMTFHFIIGMWMDDWGYVLARLSR